MPVPASGERAQSMRSAPLSLALHLGSRLLGEPFYWPTNRQMRAWVEAAGFRSEARRRVFRLPGFLLPPVLTCAVRLARVSQVSRNPRTA